MSSLKKNRFLKGKERLLSAEACTHTHRVITIEDSSLKVYFLIK